MTDVVDRRWGVASVRAAVARAPHPPEPQVRMPAPAAPAPARPDPASPPAHAAADLPDPEATAEAMAAAAPVADAGAGAGDYEPQDESAGLGRVARGVLDCARALTSISDQVRTIEERLEEIGSRKAWDVTAPLGALAEQSAGLDARVRALEARSTGKVDAGDRAGESAEARLRALEQRLGRLEALPTEVALLRREVVPRDAMAAHVADAVARQVQRLAEEMTTLPDDLAGVYRELDSVAEVVADGHAAATQGLARVKALEWAVLELRRSVERSVARTTAVPAPRPAAPLRALADLESRIVSLEGRPRPADERPTRRLPPAAPTNGAADASPAPVAPASRRPFAGLSGNDRRPAPTTGARSAGPSHPSPALPVPLAGPAVHLPDRPPADRPRYRGPMT